MDSPGIREVVSLLGLQVSPGTQKKDNMRAICPFCGHTGYTMGINTTANMYNCFACGASGGYLKLFAEVALKKTHTSGNTKEIAQELNKALGVTPSTPFTAQVKKRTPSAKRAPDAVVHKTYSAMLDLPEFALSPEHKRNLLDRGLTEADIVKNQYRSFSKNVLKKKISKREWDYYNAKVKKDKESEPTLDDLYDSEIIIGCRICKKLRDLGCTMEGVPGFFKVGSRWCISIYNGMVIPTRNIKGQIVLLQVRTKSKDNNRYLTVAPQGRPHGVNGRLSRVHFPLANTRNIDKDTAVYLTEGPLKADVAQALLGSGNALFLALHGVNNTADLPAIFKYLKEKGVTKIINALDADKTSNPNVAKASKAIRKLADEAGLRTVYKNWDQACATKLLKEALALCEANQLSLSPEGNVFLSLAKAVSVLDNAGIKPSLQWDPETKGIDDYLKTKKYHKKMTTA